MLELYRLQFGQQVSDLDSERIDSLEAGIRHQSGSWSGDVVVYTMRKRDSVFRDAEGFNITGARSRHRGMETALDWQAGAHWSVSVDATYARHTYDFNAVGRGEVFVAGRDMDSAPRLMGSVELQYNPGGRLKLGLQWTTLDEYFLDAENRFTYPGHSLVHLRASLRLKPQLELLVRLNNVTNELIADRADYASRNYRYFPGRGRELFAEIRYSLGN
jgi:outer membrane receptor protein involved in Fe transport